MHRLLVPLFLIAPIAAAAQDMPLGLTTSGTIELEYGRSDGNEAIMLNSDGLFAWRGETSSFGYGIELYGDGLSNVKDKTDSSNIWLSALLSMGSHELKLGAARPAIETVIAFPTVSTSKRVNTEAATPFTGYGTSVARLDDALVPGAALIGSAGDVSYGISGHRLDLNGGRKVNAVELAVSLTRGNTTFFGSASRASISDSGQKLNAWHIGTTYSQDGMELGLRASRTETETDLMRAAQVSGRYEVMPALDLIGGVTYIDYATADSLTLVSVGANYDINDRFYVEGGYSHAKQADSVDVGLGIKF